MRHRAMICVFLLVSMSCKNAVNKTLTKHERRDLVLSLNKFKNAIYSGNSDSINTFIPKQILRDHNFETNDVVTNCIGFFEHIDINGLNTSDSISGRNSKKEKPCMESFSIFVAADSVTFAFKMEANPNYIMTQKDLDDELDQSSLCEHIIWYNFKIVQGKLILTSLGGAD